MDTCCILTVDLLEEVLSRLTVRQLLQLRCVCKSWCFLIDSLGFIKLHYDRSFIGKDVPLLCLYNGVPELRELEGALEQYYLVCDQEWNQVLNLSNGLLGDYAHLFADPPDASMLVDCVGVVNGIICLQWRDKEIGLWNSATRDFKAIEYWLDLPNLVIGSTYWLMGFGFDSVSNEFKIVAGNRLEMPKLEEHCKLYSLSTDSWKDVSGPPAGIRTRGSPMNAYLNGVCYWPGSMLEQLESGGLRGTNVILAFNFVTETFDVFDPPKDALVIKEGFEFDWKIEVYMESIAVITSNVNYSENGHGSADIWIVSKCQDNSVLPLSWEHLFTIPQTPAFDILWVHKLKKYGRLLFLTGDPGNELDCYCLLYNISTGTSKKLGIKFNFCFSFVESLFPLSKGRL